MQKEQHYFQTKTAFSKTNAQYQDKPSMSKIDITEKMSQDWNRALVVKAYSLYMKHFWFCRHSHHWHDMHQERVDWVLVPKETGKPYITIFFANLHTQEWWMELCWVKLTNSFKKSSSILKQTCDDKPNIVLSTDSSKKKNNGIWPPKDVFHLSDHFISNQIQRRHHVSSGS